MNVHTCWCICFHVMFGFWNKSQMVSKSFQNDLKRIGKKIKRKPHLSFTHSGFRPDGPLPLSRSAFSLSAQLSLLPFAQPCSRAGPLGFPSLSSLGSTALLFLLGPKATAQLASAQRSRSFLSESLTLWAHTSARSPSSRRVRVGH